MRPSPLARELALALALTLSFSSAARAQDGSAGPGIPASPASADSQEAALAAAESAVGSSEGEKKTEESPTTPGNDANTVIGRDSVTWERERGKPEHASAPKKPEPRKSAAEKKRDAARQRRHDLALSALGQLSEPVQGSEANALQLKANGGSTTIDVGHAEEEASIGLVNSIEGQISVIEVKQAVGPVGLSADALTAKAGAEIGIDGVGVSAGLTLVEAGAELGPVAGSLGFGVGASAQLGLHGVELKLGFGLEASVSVDPLGAATGAWDAVGGLFHHHHKKKKPAAAPVAVAPATQAQRGIADCLPLQ